MRTALGLGAAALVTAGALTLQLPGSADAVSPASASQSHDSAVPAGGFLREHVVGGQSLAHAAVSALAQHPLAARQSAGTAVRATQTIVDSDGASHVRMTRTYRGLPVVGGDLVVHRGDNGAWQGVSQTLAGPLHLSVAPGLGRAAALARALAPSGATATIRNLRGAPDARPQLVVDALGAQPQLAWRVVTVGRRTDGTPSRLTSYVAAGSGRVLSREEGIETIDGSGKSLYNGTVTISIAKSGNSYTLTDVAHGNGVTTDMGNKTDSVLCTSLNIGCTNGTVYTSPDTSFGDGTNANRESAAVDAVYGGAETFDYYKSTFGRAGIFGTGAGAPSRVHYGSNYVNAFWDGTKMTYGDGDGTSYGPLVSLDVAGHEMSHGVTENTANLTYSGESGGLNEATSDIFGTMVEFYSNTASDPGDYLIGEQFDLRNHQGLRRMDDPASDGVSLNCESANAKNVDVHYSSGIGNHFYYLLAEGSGAKTLNGVSYNSPTCNGSTVTGIGRTDAQQIWFRALTTYFTSNTDYAGARTATLSAAKDLFGQGSTQYAAVAAAWSAVNVS